MGCSERGRGKARLHEPSSLFQLATRLPLPLPLPISLRFPGPVRALKFFFAEHAEHAVKACTDYLEPITVLYTEHR